jgi:hypothetical protein
MNLGKNLVWFPYWGSEEDTGVLDEVEEDGVTDWDDVYKSTLPGNFKNLRF